MVLESMNPGRFVHDNTLMTGVSVRNTFLDFSDGNIWMDRNNHKLKRQLSDSVLYCSSDSSVDCSMSSRTVQIAGERRQTPVTSMGDRSVEKEKRQKDTPEVSKLGNYPASKVEEHVVDSRERVTIPSFDLRPISSQRSPVRCREDKQDCSYLEDHYAARMDKQESIQRAERKSIHDIATQGSGVSGCTTLMMREVPLKYTQRSLMREIGLAGFKDKYDFIYLPTDARKHTNRGFAFINMISKECAEEFYKTFHGQYLQQFSAEKPIVVLPADLQGFEENALQYAVVSAPRGRHRGQTRPVFMRPLPRHIVAKLDANTPAAPIRTTSVAKPAAYIASPRSPELSMPCLHHDTQETAKAILQEALKPLVGANWPMALALALTQTRMPDEERTLQPCIDEQRNFCCYCGKKRLSDHFFCAYCGREL